MANDTAATPTHMFPDGDGYRIVFDDGTSVSAVPAAGYRRFLVRGAPVAVDTSTDTATAPTVDDTPKDSGLTITAEMIEASVKSAGGTVGNMHDTPANIAKSFNDAIADTYPNILSSKIRAAALIGECAQETAWWQTTSEYGGANASYAPYYGRGYIQCTWKDNYLAFGRWALSFDLIDNEYYFVNNPSRLADTKWAAYTAIWYFSKKWDGVSLWQWCDKVDDPWSEISRAINRGSPTSGSAAYGESARAAAIRDVLKVTADPTDPVSTDSATTGTKGETPVDDYPYPNASWHNADPWAFYYRECVSFACWRVRTRTPHKKFVNNNWGRQGSHFGNAYQWDDAAKYVGVPTGTKPKVGAIAVRNSGSSGHVAYVNKVYSDGSYDVEEYNHDWTNGFGHVYGKRHVTSSASTSNKFDTFIYFREYTG